ncbi:VanW family protein [Nocardia sp. NPDC057353]|uniref:VanW family protein n=1 Tax=Nocardia sp. NPDC057353 TaxID=3346104 RepID=UPI00363C5D95
MAALGYAADWFLSSGQVPRGTVVAGVDVGGMDTAKADVVLRSRFEARADQPLDLTIADVREQIVPAAAGLQIDWDGTWARVGDQPANPFTRLASFFTTRDVPMATAVDEAALEGTFTRLRVHDIPTVEGTIRFDGSRPVGVPPTQGRVLDGAGARDTLLDGWVTAQTLDLPVMPAPLTVRPEAVDETLRAVAQPAVSAPIRFAGRDGDAELTPAQTATVLTFAPDGSGGLAPVFDVPALTGLLAPQLAASEVEPKDATFAVGGGAARVVPGIVGEKVNWPKTLEQLAALAVASGAGRTGPAVYEKVEPKLTTQAAEALRIVEPVGQFTTSGFSGPSGVNIRTVAARVNGAVVKPGDTFSLNEFTGPRGAAEGYVESGIIDHGRPSTAVGGGISQFATTLYNAAYFAGMEDAGHTEHSYYISRYPAAREATVFDGAIDLQFRNNTETGIYIETLAGGSDITVRLWGTKTVNVESITGERTKPTEPTTVTLPEGKDCIASSGAPGFTISDTRIIRDAKTGQEISRHTRTVKYDPVPVVKCEKKDEEPKEDE